MPVLVPTIDTDQPPGEQLAPEMRAEIEELAPSQLDDGDVTTPKIADDAVTRAKIGPAAVGPTELDAAAVTTAKIADDAVTTAKIDDDAVTPAKVSDGITTIKDNAGNYIGVNFVVLTAAQYAGITPNVNTIYFVT